MIATKEMSIGEVLKMDRGTASVFMEHGMHCLGCPHATAESLEDAGMVHGIDVDALVDNLNAYLASNGKK
jgi:hybrid cluster-associated redox disulfide protein